MLTGYFEHFSIFEKREGKKKTNTFKRCHNLIKEKKRLVKIFILKSRDLKLKQDKIFEKNNEKLIDSVLRRVIKSKFCFLIINIFQYDISTTERL